MYDGKPKWWWVWHINCDCASYDWPRSSAQEPRQCRGCKKKIGPMSFNFMAKVQAITSRGAVCAAKAEN